MNSTSTANKSSTVVRLEVKMVSNIILYFVVERTLITIGGLQCSKASRQKKNGRKEKFMKKTLDFRLTE